MKRALRVFVLCLVVGSCQQLQEPSGPSVGSPPSFADRKIAALIGDREWQINGVGANDNPLNFTQGSLKGFSFAAGQYLPFGLKQILGDRQAKFLAGLVGEKLRLFLEEADGKATELQAMITGQDDRGRITFIRFTWEERQFTLQIFY